MIFKSEELLIEKIVHETIKFRSKKRLNELQSAFDNIKYCKSNLRKDKKLKQRIQLKSFFLISRIIRSQTSFTSSIFDQ
jgi:hypothetical protein